MNWDLWLFNMTCHFRQRLRPRGPLDAWLRGLCLSSNQPMPACSIKCPSALQQLKDFGLRKLFFRGGHPRTDTLFVIQCAKPDSPGSKMDMLRWNKASSLLMLELYSFLSSFFPSRARPRFRLTHISVQCSSTPSELRDERSGCRF